MLFEKSKEYKAALSTAKIIDRMSVHTPKQGLPSHSSKEQLVEEFAGYFDNTMNTLRHDLEAISPILAAAQF